MGRDAPLAEWLRTLRLRTELTQADVATAAETGLRNVQRYEAGNTEPRAGEFLRLLSALSVTLEPLPPESVYLSVNGELRALREELQAAAGAGQEDEATTHRLLGELAEAVAELGLGLAQLEPGAGALPGRRRARGGQK